MNTSGSVAIRRAIVSGGAGFIGSHVVRALLDEGWRVVVLDNLMTGREENLEQFSGMSGFEFVKCDVSSEVVVAGDVTDVLHLASPASPVDFANYPVEILKVGTFGTHHMLEMALAKEARFLLASTSEVYGDPLIHPQPESYYGNVNPTGPRSCYDEAKRSAEAFTMAYHRSRRVDTRIVRIFNTYGPGMRADDGRAVPNFIGQALTNKSLTVYGDGSQTRSFCYVGDLVAGLLATLASGDNQPINLGSSSELTVLELAQAVIRLTGSQSRIQFLPLPADDPRQRCPDISRARATIGWEPHTVLEDGLVRTIDYFRKARAE